jgi:hypothetical protein
MKTTKRIHECPPYQVWECDGGDACWDVCQRDGRYITVEVEVCPRCGDRPHDAYDCDA